MTQRLNPCNECPFRKKSLRGYVGPHENAAEIADLVLWEQKFPCHMDANRLHAEAQQTNPHIDFEDVAEDAPHCAGAIAFMNNTAKLSRDPDIKKLQDEVGKRDDIFPHRQAMIDYHDKKPNKGKKVRKQKTKT